jgi:integrase
MPPTHRSGTTARRVDAMNELTLRQDLYAAMLAPRADHYGEHLKPFARFAQGQPITPILIASYFRTLNGEPVSASTKLVRRHAVKSRLRLALDAELDFNRRAALEQMIKGLDREVKPPKVQRSPVGIEKVIRRDELDRLLAAASRRDSLWLRLLWATGVRISEAIGVRVDQCEPAGDFVRLRILGKGNKERFVKIRMALFLDIREEFKGQVLLFETATGKPFSRNYVTAQVRKLAQRVLGRRLSCHNLRHSFATRQVLNHPGKVDAISNALGHAQTSTTVNMYCHTAIPDDELWGSD